MKTLQVQDSRGEWTDVVNVDSVLDDCVAHSARMPRLTTLADRSATLAALESGKTLSYGSDWYNKIRLIDLDAQRKRIAENNEILARAARAHDQAVNDNW